MGGLAGETIPLSFTHNDIDYEKLSVGGTTGLSIIFLKRGFQEMKT